MEINLSSTTVFSYIDLMRTIQKTLYAAWGKDKVKFTAAYPKKSETESIKPPIITYSVLSKEAADLKGTQEIKPRIREVVKLVEHNDLNEDVPEKDKRDIAVELWGQMFDYRILFEIWATDGEEADKIAEDFQHFMFNYTGFYKKSGAQEIIFQSMDSNNGSAQWKTDLIKRSIVYFIRLDEVTGVRCAQFEEFIVTASPYPSAYHMLFDIPLKK